MICTKYAVLLDGYKHANVWTDDFDHANVYLANMKLDGVGGALYKREGECAAHQDHMYRKLIGADGRWPAAIARRKLCVAGGEVRGRHDS